MFQSRQWSWWCFNNLKIFCQLTEVLVNLRLFLLQYPDNNTETRLLPTKCGGMLFSEVLSSNQWSFLIKFINGNTIFLWFYSVMEWFHGKINDEISWRRILFSVYNSLQIKNLKKVEIRSLRIGSNTTIG